MARGPRKLQIAFEATTLTTGREMAICHPGFRFNSIGTNGKAGPGGKMESGKRMKSCVFLATLALAAIRLVIAGLVQISPGNPIQAENARPGTTAWQITDLITSVNEITGYEGKPSGRFRK
jgi:hypothetical protein